MFSDDPDDQADAIALCARCGLNVVCLAAALAGHERAGIWGGFTARQRSGIITAARRRVLQPDTTASTPVERRRGRA